MINARLKANNLHVWNPVTASPVLDLTVVGQLHNTGVQTEFTMKDQPILKWHIQSACFICNLTSINLQDHYQNIKCNH